MFRHGRGGSSGSPVFQKKKTAGFPLSKILIVSAVMKGLLKVLDAKALNHLGFEPEMVQVLIKLSIEDKGIK